MQCPNCKSDSIYTVDTRQLVGKVRRRRECAECDHRFSTVEVIVVPYKSLTKSHITMTPKGSTVVVVPKGIQVETYD